MRGTPGSTKEGVGYDDREPPAAELEQMKALVRAAMAEGAVGVGAALIYPPGCYAQTEELIELKRVTGEREGLFTARAIAGALAAYF